MLRIPAWLLLAVAVSGCGHKDAASGDDDDTNPTTVPLPVSATLLLEDASQLVFTHTEDIPVFSVSVGQDFGLDWGGLATDVWGRPASPLGVASVALALREGSVAAVSTSLAEVGPDPVAFGTFWAASPAGTSTVASALMLQGSTFPVANMQAGQVYTVAVLDGEGKALSVAVLSVDGGADDVVFGAARYGATITLSARTPSTTSALRPWTLDWSGLTTDAVGAPLDPTNLETLFVAQWASEEQIDLLDPASADGYWAKYVPGSTSLDPETMHGFDGNLFPGFEAVGVYVVGFRCTGCATALPRFATRILVPE